MLFTGLSPVTYDANDVLQSILKIQTSILHNNFVVPLNYPKLFQAETELSFIHRPSRSFEKMLFALTNTSMGCIKQKAISPQNPQRLFYI